MVFLHQIEKIENPETRKGIALGLCSLISFNQAAILSRVSRIISLVVEVLLDVESSRVHQFTFEYFFHPPYLIFPPFFLPVRPISYFTAANAEEDQSAMSAVEREIQRVCVSKQSPTFTVLIVLVYTSSWFFWTWKQPELSWRSHRENQSKRLCSVQLAETKQQPPIRLPAGHRDHWSSYFATDSTRDSINYNECGRTDRIFFADRDGHKQREMQERGKSERKEEKKRKKS